MIKRRENSKGQALVMVTLALLAMAGMMGLAVDLGWSFFVQKQAQAAADGAALAAVQEAMAQLASGSTVTSLCTAGFTPPAGVQCTAAAAPCPAAKNLQVGCLYAKANGFDYTSTTSQQNVTIQAGTGTPPTVPGLNGVVYWVTVRTVQTVPQLFSAVLGNTQGTVSAIATAAIAPSIGPGSFFGMDQAGDQGDPGNVGIDLQGRNSGSASKSTCNGDICAPMGFILSSQCAGSAVAVGGGACSSNSSDAADGGAQLAIGSPVIVAGAGVAINFQSASTSVPAGGKTFADFFAPNPQPQLQAQIPTTAANSIISCGYLANTLTSGATIPSGGGPLGPYQYYAYYPNGGINQPTGGPIQLPDGATFTTANNGCPGGIGMIQSGSGIPSGLPGYSSFPAYIFWGGAVASNATFGPGQYVMAGTSSSSGSVFDITGKSPGVTGDSAIGTMFIFTDGRYPGLWTSSPSAADGTGQIQNIPGGLTYLAGLYQGSLGPFKDAVADLYGVVYQPQGSTAGMPPSMDVYSGVVWWQDRRNSNVGYDQPMSTTCAIAACTGDNGSVIYCNNNSCTALGGTPPTSFINGTNHVTPTSVGLNFDPGNGRIGLNGAYYQPRGAWMNITAGNDGFDCGGAKNVVNCPLQIVTGMLDLNHGTVNVNLAGPTNPILTYKARLVQ